MNGRFDMKTMFAAKYVVCILIMIFPHYAEAASDSVKNDQNNYLGDRVTFPVRIHVKIDSVDYCIPGGTPLKGLGSANDNGDVIFRMSSYRTYKACDGKTKIPDDIPFTVDGATLKNYSPDRIGLTYGMLVVPYKYQAKGSKEFDGQTSVGPYFGYRFDKSSLGFGFKFIGFIGASSISVTQNVNGTDETQNLMGLSYGLGIIGQAKNEFQMGVVFGADRVSESANYVNNGKMWIAIALGYSFAN